MPQNNNIVQIDEIIFDLYKLLNTQISRANNGEHVDILNTVQSIAVLIDCKSSNGFCK